MHREQLPIDHSVIEGSIFSFRPLAVGGHAANILLRSSFEQRVHNLAPRSFVVLRLVIFADDAIFL
jgi:hypothetical protein